MIVKHNLLLFYVFSQYTIFYKKSTAIRTCRLYIQFFRPMSTVKSSGFLYNIVLTIFNTNFDRGQAYIITFIIPIYITYKLCYLCIYRSPVRMIRDNITRVHTAYHNVGYGYTRKGSIKTCIQQYYYNVHKIQSIV